MVKRAKLTLEHPTVKEKGTDSNPNDCPPPNESDQPAGSPNKKYYGKLLLVAGITIVSLFLFRQKII